jgi:hypothetical protein
MKQELDDKLCRDFPNLYKERNLPMQQTCMYWGFECGDGWEPLIRRLSEKLEPLGVVATQVKEKYGTLRFYFDAPSSETMDAAYLHIRQAEVESAVTCEACGEAGGINKDGYWKSVRCTSCGVDERR